MNKSLKSFFNIKLIYAIVFITLASWSFFAYYTMSKLITEQEVYAKIINLSGKQRMLSQKTTLIAKRYYESKNPLLKEHLNELVLLMEKDHKYIINNLSSSEMESIYFNKPYMLNEKVKLYISSLNDFLNTNDIKILKEIEETSFALLPKLNHAVNSFEKESNTLTENLLQREYFIFIGTIITLILEGIFIVIPSIQIAREKEEELKQLNNSLEKRIKDAVKENTQKEDILKQQFRLAQMGEIVGNIAHQWRQPLSMISSLASGTKIEKQFNLLDDKKLEANLDFIVEKTQDLSQTIETFELYTKENETTNFCIQEEISKTINIINDSFKSYNINIKSQIDDKNVLLKGNQKDFLQVLLNILNNAKDVLLNKNGEKEIFISLKINNDNNNILIVMLKPQS